MPVDVYVYGKPHCHASACPARALVVGPARRLPAAKDSHWVLERAPLERALSAGSRGGPAEGLLCDASGRLLEGLVTNLFVVAGAPPASGLQPPPPRLSFLSIRLIVVAVLAEADAAGGGVELQTAASSDGVLKGVMRGFVLEARALLAVCATALLCMTLRA